MINEPNHPSPKPRRPFPSSANLSDALGQMGFKFQTLDGRIRSITGLSVWGPAFTVQCYPGATWAVEEALEQATPGDVLVVSGGGYHEAVLMGGLLSGRARHRGLAGAVIDGAVRDVRELHKLHWPVYACGVTPRAGTVAKLGQLSVSISCGGVVIQPGDLIAGDEDGVVAIPSLELENAMALAWEIERKEDFIAEAVNHGLSLTQAVQKFQSLPQ